MTNNTEQYDYEECDIFLTTEEMKRTRDFFIHQDFIIDYNLVAASPIDLDIISFRDLNISTNLPIIEIRKSLDEGVKWHMYKGEIYIEYQSFLDYLVENYEELIDKIDPELERDYFFFQDKRV